MDELSRFNRLRIQLALLLVVCLLYQNLIFCWSLNAEGSALLRFRERVVRDPYGALSNWNSNDVDEDPCSWFGVECSDRKVVILNLKDLCLGGTLAPELGNLVHIKSIILRNNSFSGIIPNEIERLKELEVLDLGYNNFSGPLPSDIGSNLSLAILLLDNNRFLGSMSPELHELCMLSELQVDENQLSSAAKWISCDRISSSWNIGQGGDVAYRRLLQEPGASSPPKPKDNTKTNKNKTKKKNNSDSSPTPSPLPSPFHSPSLSPTNSFPPTSPVPTPNPVSPAPPVDPPIVSTTPPPIHSPSASPSYLEQSSSQKKHHAKWLILAGGIGASVLVFILFAGFFICRSTKVVVVKPWVTGLSGQLRKAFVTGVPKLKRSELETACEDFSNVIGSSSNGTMYKGTLSTGVEIAVTSTLVTSAKDWSKQLEAEFRTKIDTLSKVNHKNFVSLLGFCEEEEPFTRMMVFEYAPNGTLFEHLHIKEAEHLDWGTRLRIAMGMSYCLDHMHQLTPPILVKNLQSTTVYLTEDYAAKFSDFAFWNGSAVANMGSAGLELLYTPSSDLEGNVYSFGLILLEMITGRLPYSSDNDPLVDWASDYLIRKKPLCDMVDPTLKSFQEDTLEKLCEVILSCVDPNPQQRPTMREVTIRLREITAMAPDEATPRLSPLWWAELEILSAETS